MSAVYLVYRLHFGIGRQRSVAYIIINSAPAYSEVDDLRNHCLLRPTTHKSSLVLPFNRIAVELTPETSLDVVFYPVFTLLRTHRGNFVLCLYPHSTRLANKGSNVRYCLSEDLAWCLSDALMPLPWPYCHSHACFLWSGIPSLSWLSQIKTRIIYNSMYNRCR